MAVKEKHKLLIFLLLIGWVLCACGKEAEQSQGNDNLPVAEQERKEAENDCRKIMELYFPIYEEAKKGMGTDVVLDEKTIWTIQKKVAKTGFSVTASIPYSDMENPGRFEAFLKNCIDGKSGSGVVYKVQQDGNIERMKFTFDGTDMYVTSIRGVWHDNGRVGLENDCTTGIREWKYTQKGWFCYEMCVPEPPAVSEVINGYCRIRIKPMTQELRELSRKCVWTLGYQGNNLLCSNWDTEHMEALDYNGLYEYLYEMKYGEKFPSENSTCGIPAEEFESLIMEYLPMTTEQLREYAVYDKENQTYAWERLGCLNYAPTAFGTSVPEVTDIRENADGTVTLTVDAMCDMVTCDDAVITHELTMRFAENGSFQYLGNQILDNGVKEIPEYQYRIME